MVQTMTLDELKKWLIDEIKKTDDKDLLEALHVTLKCDDLNSIKKWSVKILAESWVIRMQ